LRPLHLQPFRLLCYPLPLSCQCAYILTSFFACHCHCQIQPIRHLWSIIATMCNSYFYRFLFRTEPRLDKSQRLLSQNGKMLSASMSAAAVLYASVISTTTLFQTRPEDAPQLKHHAKGGKGFLNPWDSYVDLSPAQIGGAFFSSVSSIFLRC